MNKLNIIFLILFPLLLLSQSSLDFNGDGKIDNSDKSLLRANIGTSNSTYDLDGNGRVNGKDLSIIIRYIENSLTTPTNFSLSSPSDQELTVDISSIPLFVQQIQIEYSTSSYVDRGVGTLVATEAQTTNNLNKTYSLVDPNSLYVTIFFNGETGWILAYKETIDVGDSPPQDSIEFVLTHVVGQPFYDITYYPSTVSDTDADTVKTWYSYTGTQASDSAALDTVSYSDLQSDSLYAFEFLDDTLYVWSKVFDGSGNGGPIFADTLYPEVQDIDPPNTTAISLTASVDSPGVVLTIDENTVSSDSPDVGSYNSYWRPSDDASWTFLRNISSPADTTFALSESPGPGDTIFVKWAAEDNNGNEDPIGIIDTLAFSSTQTLAFTTSDTLIEAIETVTLFRNPRDSSQTGADSIDIDIANCPISGDTFKVPILVSNNTAIGAYYMVKVFGDTSNWKWYPQPTAPSTFVVSAGDSSGTDTTFYQISGFASESSLLPDSMEMRANTGSTNSYPSSRTDGSQVFLIEFDSTLVNDDYSVTLDITPRDTVYYSLFVWRNGEESPTVKQDTAYYKSSVESVPPDSSDVFTVVGDANGKDTLTVGQSGWHDDDINTVTWAYKEDSEPSSISDSTANLASFAIADSSSYAEVGFSIDWSNDKTVYVYSYSEDVNNNIQTYANANQAFVTVDSTGGDAASWTFAWDGLYTGDSLAGYVNGDTQDTLQAFELAGSAEIVDTLGSKWVHIFGNNDGIRYQDLGFDSTVVDDSIGTVFFDVYVLNHSSDLFVTPWEATNSDEPYNNRIYTAIVSDSVYRGTHEGNNNSEAMEGTDIINSKTTVRIGYTWDVANANHGVKIGSNDWDIVNDPGMSQFASDKKINGMMIGELGAGSSFSCNLYIKDVKVYRSYQATE